FALVFVEAAKHQILGGDQLLVILCGFGTKSLEFGISFFSMTISGAMSYAFSDSLLLTPLCCDDIHDVTSRVSALAGCDRLVSEPLVIENFDVLVGMDRLSKRKFGIVCHEKVVRIPLEGNEIFRVHGERTQGVVKTLMNTKVEEEHEVHLKLVLELLRKKKLHAKVTYLRFIANFSKIVKPHTSLTERNQKKERVKPRRVRAMAMTIQYGVRGMILVAQSKAFKQENVLAERLHGLRYLSENEIESPWILSVNFQGQSSEYDVIWEWNSGDDQLRFRWMIYLVVLADATKSVSDAIRFEYCLASLRGWTKSPVIWAKIGGSSLIGPELVQETTDMEVLIKEKLKVARDHQKSYADNRHKPLEFEGKLAPRYVGPFEIFERIGLVAYRLRLPEELSEVHDTFHVSNLKKCLADASLHLPLDEIKVDKTLRFIEEPVEIMDREVKRFVLVFVEAAKYQVTFLPVIGFSYFVGKILGGDQLLVILCGFGTKSLEFGISFLTMTISGAASYAFSDSLLLTPLCCDDIHDVTPRVSALAGCDTS
ncbi:hypothetical protein Tco_0777471, partial [Tanacetum coccineum]